MMKQKKEEIKFPSFIGIDTPGHEMNNEIEKTRAAQRPGESSSLINNSL